MQTEGTTVAAAAEAFLGAIDSQGRFPGEEEYDFEATPEVDEDEVTEDESESEGAEAEEDEGADEADTEDEDESEEESEKLIEIQIGEDTYEVNEEELKSGYLRNEDYQSHLATLQTEHESRLADVDARESELIGTYNELLAQAAGELGQFQNVNWVALKANNPEQYATARIAYIEANERAQEQATKRQNLVAAHEKMQELRHSAYLKGQAEVARKLLPDFDKEEFHTALVGYGKNIGFTEEEVRGVADARHLVLLDKARRYDELQAKKKGVIEGKVSKDLPPVVKPGAPKASGQEAISRVKHARAQLGKSGSVKDAASVFLTSGIFD